jgi:rhodanese-related sulfurtransferase
LLENNGSAVAVFTGDTLFIGDCGRPDLRETTGNITATRHTLAADMYHSLRNQLMPLPDQVQVYPAHGAGSLCGKALSTANSSTIAAEKQTNWCLQPQTEAEFVAELIADQPFVPKYFGYNVEINKKGADHYQKNIEKIAHLGQIYQKNAADILDKNTIIIDTRPQDIYNAGNFDNSINLMIGGKFETWLGSIVAPHQNFYLTAENQQQIDELISRIAKIGYETQIKATFIGIYDEKQAVNINVQQFIDNKADYTIVDIRNVAEARQKPIFDNALHIPLAELSDRTHEIPTHKPIVVHCAGGYRSAAGASIIKNNITNNIKNNQDTNPNKAVIVYDLGVAITQF